MGCSKAERMTLMGWCSKFGRMQQDTTSEIGIGGGECGDDESQFGMQ